MATLEMTQRPTVLLISTGYKHGIFLEHAKIQILHVLGKNKDVLFIPYAWAEDRHDKYIQQFRDTTQKWGLNSTSLHEIDNKIEAVKSSKAILVGGGNTFRLLAALYSHQGLMKAIQQRVVQDGVPYIGISAGAVIATPAIMTTGSKPVAYPPSLRGLNIIPYLVLPHYKEGERDNSGQVHTSGGASDTDIWEVVNVTGCSPVIAIPDHSTLLFMNNTCVIQGRQGAVLFQRPDERTVLSDKHVLPYCEPTSIPDHIAGPPLI